MGLTSRLCARASCGCLRAVMHLGVGVTLAEDRVRSQLLELIAPAGLPERANSKATTFASNEERNMFKTVRDKSIDKWRHTIHPCDPCVGEGKPLGGHELQKCLTPRGATL